MPSSVWQDDCNELDDWMPWSRTRRWAGLQFIGNRDHPVHFQQGLDVVLPVYLLGHRAQSQRDDLPSCGQMATDSPFSSWGRRCMQAESHVVVPALHGGGPQNAWRGCAGLAGGWRGCASIIRAVARSSFSHLLGRCYDRRSSQRVVVLTKALEHMPKATFFGVELKQAKIK